MFEMFTFFTDTFQAPPVLCRVANVLAELLVLTDFLNFFSYVLSQCLQCVRISGKHSFFYNTP